MDILKLANENKDIIIILLYIFQLVISSANKSIATVSEIMQKSQMTDADAMDKAVALFRKYFPFIPEIIARWLLQIVFDNIKKQAK